MDNADFTADVSRRLAEELRAGKAAEIARRFYAEQGEVRERDWDGIEARRRDFEAVSERAHNCPRGEYR